MENLKKAQNQGTTSRAVQACCFPKAFIHSMLFVLPSTASTGLGHNRVLTGHGRGTSTVFSTHHHFVILYGMTAIALEITIKPCKALCCCRAQNN